MKVLLDACVLYPTVMREMLLGVARSGVYTPLWSERILEEWARAARNMGPEGETIARGEIALIQSAFPGATVLKHPGLEARLWLPDENDIHVLAVAIHGNADAIVTMNAKDFPRGILAEEGLVRIDPDAFLLGFYHSAPDEVMMVAEKTVAEARRLSGEDWNIRSLLKKARLPRLGKALTG
ncbi:RSP_2648 family PIN domain-containing protein [Sulfitobacter sp.]|uniref:RSP_2648 family PIN domain-containing protein n=1 Tax=Sulfitobacter sp. TaxID=1903071 RepID=UPI0030019D35